MHAAVLTVARASCAALGAALLLGTTAGPAAAAGTGGVEVTPLPGVVDGRQVTAFHVRVGGRQEQRVAYALRNLTSRRTSARLYVASATRQEGGGFSIGAAGSAPGVVLPEQRVDLAPGVLQRRSFTVRGPVDRPAYAAVVVEVRNGSVLTRAATLVYLRPRPAPPVSPLLALGAAATALAAGAGAVVVAHRRRAADTEALTARARALAVRLPVGTG